MKTGRITAATALALLIVFTGATYQSVMKKPNAGAQAVSVSPAQGPAGATGAAGTPGSVVQARTVTTNSSGSVTWTYPAAYAGGVVPIVTCLAVASSGSTDVINCQSDGAPTNTSAAFKVTRTQQSVVALLGLTILSVPASVGVTTLHVTAETPTP